MSIPAPILLGCVLLAGATADDTPTVRWIDRPTAAAAPPAQPVQLALSASTADTPQLHSTPPINIQVEDADIRSVLRLFSNTSGLNFVVPDTVQSTVTAHLADVPWDLALAAILSAEGLQAVPYSGDVVLIQPIGTP